MSRCVHSLEVPFTTCMILLDHNIGAQTVSPFNTNITPTKSLDVFTKIKELSGYEFLFSYTKKPNSG